ncbi:cysteine--tRNA ligase [Candidatus Daviesbacteria bacterium]|nr:cysteine--tRNA ligase [Candidatus Daviesbacteria bacterium]
MFRLYNSLTQTKKKFSPLNPDRVLMYVCGVTPYDTTHIGHAFTYMVFDVLKRFLEFKGYRVVYTQNVTDIDDDILSRAKKDNQNWKELGKFWTNKFLSDLKSLNIKMPTYYVKATDSITTMIKMIQKLVKEGFAYKRRGQVYFRVNRFNRYRQLSKLTKEQMKVISKERGASPDDPLKEDPLDFLLWSKSLADEPYWDSPWGKGRPGWHIECSAMILEYLGEQIDIHGGGHDLIYPHHESEVAQSEVYTKKVPFVKYWLHTSMLLYQGKKMSKSLGNLIMVSNLLKRYSPNSIRYLFLSHHYRQPWEFVESALTEAEERVKLIRALLSDQSFQNPGLDRQSLKTFTKALDDDLNTPKVTWLIDRLVFKIQKEMDIKKKAIYQNTLRTLLRILGFSNL